MPRKAKTTTTTTPTEKTVVQGTYWLTADAPWGGFINLRLTDEEKEQFVNWDAAHPDEGWRILVDFMGEGGKVAITYDRENECYITSLTGALCSPSNHRYCVSSRSSTVREAVQIAAWKHFVLANGDYGSFSPKTGRLNNWG